MSELGTPKQMFEIEFIDSYDWFVCMVHLNSRSAFFLQNSQSCLRLYAALKFV